MLFFPDVRRGVGMGGRPIVAIDHLVAGGIRQISVIVVRLVLKTLTVWCRCNSQMTKTGHHAPFHVAIRPSTLRWRKSCKGDRIEASLRSSRQVPAQLRAGNQRSRPLGAFPVLPLVLSAATRRPP